MAADYAMIVDFETDSTDPLTTQPVQIAAIPICRTNLKIELDKAFVSDIKPDDFEKINKDTLAWHAKIQKKTEEEVLERWKAAPSLKVVWNSFQQYVNQFNNGKNKWTAPVAVAHNGNNFDFLIIDRVHKLYGSKTMFNARDRIDTMQLCWLWFESLLEPKSYSLDNLRSFLGMNNESISNAHDALQDVKDLAEIFVRFTNLHRRVAKNTKFKNSFSQQTSLAV